MPNSIGMRIATAYCVDIDSNVLVLHLSLLEIPRLFILYVIILMTWVFASLHVAFSKDWTEIVFIIFNFAIVSMIADMNQNNERDEGVLG